MSDLSQAEQLITQCDELVSRVSELKWKSEEELKYLHKCKKWAQIVTMCSRIREHEKPDEVYRELRGLKSFP